MKFYRNNERILERLDELGKLVKGDIDASAIKPPEISKSVPSVPQSAKYPWYLYFDIKFFGRRFPDPLLLPFGFLLDRYLNKRGL